MSKIYYNRRKFVKLSTAAAVGGSAVLSGINFPAEASMQNIANDKTLRLGFVGIGGRG